jgi:hypothetical protein
VQQPEHEAPNTDTSQHEKVKSISQYDDLARVSEIEAPSSQDKILSSQNVTSNNMQRPRTTPSGAPPRAGSTGHPKTQSVKTVAVAEAASATAAHYTDVSGANDAGSKSHVCGNVPVLSESDHDSAVTTDEGEASEEESGQTASYQYSSDTESCEDPQDSEHATSTKRVDMEASYQYSSDNESCEHPQDLEHRSTCQVLGGSAPSAPATSVGGKVLCRTGSMRGSVQMSPITSCQLCLV